jgi:hypothetical protein
MFPQYAGPSRAAPPGTSCKPKLRPATKPISPGILPTPFPPPRPSLLPDPIPHTPTPPLSPSGHHDKARARRERMNGVSAAASSSSSLAAARPAACRPFRLTLQKGQPCRFDATNILNARRTLADATPPHLRGTLRWVSLYCVCDNRDSPAYRKYRNGH